MNEEEKKEIKVLQKRTERLMKKIIDKQNKVIDKIIQEYEYNARINVKDFCEECQRKDKCIQDCHTHIKQYFIRKVNGDDKD